MCRFIESIRVENQEVALLEMHQQRMNRSINSLKKSNPHCLNTLFAQLHIPNHEVYKWRLVYDENQIYTNEANPYKPIIQSDFELVEIQSFHYSLKWEKRDFFNKIKQNSPASDVIFTQNDQILESSYANLVFHHPEGLFTPKMHLLNGVQRQYLLKTFRIKERKISIEQLHEYSHFQLINALMNLEHSPIYETISIKNLDQSIYFHL